MRRNCLLKNAMDGKIGGRIDDEEEVSSYWMILKKEGILEI